MLLASSCRPDLGNGNCSRFEFNNGGGLTLVRHVIVSGAFLSFPVSRDWGIVVGLEISPASRVFPPLFELNDRDIGAFCTWSDCSSISITEAI